MDAQTGFHSEAEGPRAIRFTGSWREYLPIAVTNALLCIVTLGIYRFWASARQRRYLWSRTMFIDDCLEWSGTGKEMFLGFLIVLCVLVPFYLFFQFAFPALIARGKTEAAFGAISLFELGIFYLAGFARFRALRYRLSRSWWHGIRGGSDNPGWNYGGEYLGRYLLTFITMFIMFPWATTRLWNSRWNAMSFGQLKFRADLDADGLGLRWLLVYVAPIAALLLAVGLMFLAGALVESVDANPKSPTLAGIFVSIFLLVYLVIPLATLNWFAAFYRKAADSLELGDLRFGFDATTWDWLKLVLGTLGLIIVTLGFGLTYAGYRNWAFMVRHMHVYGDVDVSKLEQSTTHAPTEAEGFADAFDIGAI
jgi:uncharacterized membrane protein YjgN (DUF898 family)